MADDVCVLIPTLDEATTIGDVVTSFREEGFEHVLVVDGGSTDGTKELAREAGARVIQQTGEGKGKAVRQGITDVDHEYVLLVDGDGTYCAEDAHELLAPLRSGEASHVIGNRFGDMHPDAMSRLNRVGNRVINWAYRLVHRRDHHDILSGYRAFTRDSAERMVLSADGFGIETEMAVQCVKEGIDTVEVPITYRPRPAGSETKLHPFLDGGTILLTLYRLAKTNNPLFYFGSVGVCSLMIGSAFALFVVYRWVTAGVGHEILALAGAAGILLGVQLLMFGVLSDMIVSLHGDQRRRIQRLERVAGARDGEDEWNDPTSAGTDHEAVGGTDDEADDAELSETGDVAAGETDESAAGGESATSETTDGDSSWPEFDDHEDRLEDEAAGPR